MPAANTDKKDIWAAAKDVKVVTMVIMKLTAPTSVNLTSKSFVWPCPFQFSSN